MPKMAQDRDSPDLGNPMQVFFQAQTARLDEDCDAGMHLDQSVKSVDAFFPVPGAPGSKNKALYRAPHPEPRTQN
jgi:hypothetical protein